MSDQFMSDSEEEGGDFSASEDEWLPERASGKKGRGRKATSSETHASSESSGDEDEDGGDNDEEVASKRPKAPKSKAADARKPRAPPKSKLSASARKKLYEKYRLSVGKDDSKKEVDSDSSGDEHLVKPEQLDLNSDFFQEAPVEQPPESAPQFDCNPGVRLSDSSERDDSDMGESSKPELDEEAKRQANKDLIAKINQNSQSFVNFEGLSQFNKEIEQAKKQLTSFKARESKSETVVDIGDLLAMGEHHEEETNTKPAKRSKAKKKKKDESDSDWEEVEEKEEPEPPHDVQITLEVGPKRAQKKKRCNNEIDIEACLKRMVNREKQANQIVLHKVNIVMAIAHGNYINGVLNSPKLLELALTLVPSQKCYPKDRTNLQYFEQITKFFKEIIDLKDRRMYCRFKKLPQLETSLRLQMLTKAAICKRDYILLFIILLRTIGVQCRMVMSLVVAPLKLPQSERLQLQSNKPKAKPADSEEDEEPPSKAKPKPTTASVGKGRKTKSSAKDDHDYDGGETKKKSNNSKRKAASCLAKIPQLDGNDDLTGVPSKKSKLDASRKKIEHTKDEKSSSDFRINTSNLQEMDMFSPRKTRRQRQEQNNSCAVQESSKPKIPKPNDQSPAVASPSPSSSSILIRKDYTSKPVKNTSDKQNSESTKETKSIPKAVSSNSKANQANKQSKNVTPKAIQPSPKEQKASNSGKSKTTPKSTPKILKVEIFDKKLKQRLDRRVLSTDDEFRQAPDDQTKVKSGVNLWIEVYSEDEEQWVPIDVVGAKVHCLEQIVRMASSPLVYIFAWNNDGSIKDVSTRYCPNFVTSTKKLRIDDDWLDETLEKFEGKRTARDIEEDRALNRAVMEQPLPKTIGEYKNHPLYALKRHLLKFEGIYPVDAPTLGFIREEPVYARECVQTLHSREIWLKQARTVKMFETPYKVVSARPKYDRASGQMLPAQPLELFGYWQTQEYEPPTAEGGVVPRNAYGNVELFKPCMLPKKTVHLQLPSLNRICKKLGIDCAQAVTGFDFHGGSSHPVYDGFVVCEEFKDVVVDAWYQEQEQEEKREREKYEKRVYGNWRKLIKGLLIRRKLQNKYNFDNL